MQQLGDAKIPPLMDPKDRTFIHDESTCLNFLRTVRVVFPRIGAVGLPCHFFFWGVTDGRKWTLK